MSRISDIKVGGIYGSLMREFIRHGHEVYIVSPTERRFSEGTHIKVFDHCKILRVKTLNLQKTNVVEKGVGQLLLERQFMKALKRHWHDVQFDLVLYSTPPITFNKVITYVKNRYQAKSYLLLKDIFPQNAVDLGMFSEKSFFYKMFRKKEERLYELSDFIGCMSPANVQYVIDHNPTVDPKKVEVAPNSVELNDNVNENDNRKTVREKYGLPTDVPILIYGGNLGKPQGIDFLIRCLEQNKHRRDCHYVVIGNGTEYGKLEGWYNENEKHNDNENENFNVTVMQRLPKEDYDVLVQSCDVGLIFLDHRFTIPNYPSRLLSYLEYKMPVICCTDPNTDIGRIAEENGYGYWCESVRPDAFTNLVNKILSEPERIREMGERGYQFLKDNYTVDKCYDIIMKHFHVDE